MCYVLALFEETLEDTPDNIIVDFHYPPCILSLFAVRYSALQRWSGLPVPPFLLLASFLTAESSPTSSLLLPAFIACQISKPHLNRTT